MYLKNSAADTTYEITAQDLHNRAREASSELQRLLITLGTAVLGVSFFWITEDRVAATELHFRWLLVITLASAGFTVLFGIFSWLADAKRCYYWAKSLQAQTPQRKSELSVLSRRWKMIVRLTKWISRGAFILSIVGLTIYIIPQLLR